MTGIQSTAANEQNQAAAVLAGALPSVWTDEGEITAIAAAIPPAHRKGLLASLRALISSGGSDSYAGAFNA